MIEDYIPASWGPSPFQIARDAASGVFEIYCFITSEAKCQNGSEWKNIVKYFYKTFFSGFVKDDNAAAKLIPEDTGKLLLAYTICRKLWVVKDHSVTIRRLPMLMYILLTNS